MAKFQNENESQKWVVDHLPPQIFSAHVEPLGDFGHPDLHLWTNEKIILVEHKCVNDLNVKVRKTFTKYQIPWYIRYLQKGGNILYLNLFHKKNNEWLTCHIDKSIYDIDLDKNLDQFDWKQTPDIIGWVCNKLYI